MILTVLPTPRVIRRRRWLVAILAILALAAAAALAYATVLSAGSTGPTIESAPVDSTPIDNAPAVADAQPVSDPVDAVVEPADDADEDAVDGATDEAAEPLAGAGRFVDVPTTRLLDTRSGSEMAPVPAAGATVEAEIGDLVPGTGVSTVVLSVNVAMAQGPGPVSVSASDDADPVTAIEVVGAGQMTTNLVFVPHSPGAPITVTTDGGGHLVVDLIGYFEDVDAAGAGSAAGRFVPVATQRLARLVTEVDGREAVVSPLANPALPASGVSSVVVRITADVGGEGGMVRLGADPEALPNTMMWAETSGDDRTRQGVAIVSLSELDELAFTYNGGSVLDLDVLGYFTDDSALPTRSGLFVPVDDPGGTSIAATVRAGEATTVSLAPVLGVDPTQLGAVAVNVFATSDSPGELFVKGPTQDTPSSATVELGAGTARFGFTATLVGNDGDIVINSNVDASVTLVVPGYFLR